MLLRSLSEYRNKNSKFSGGLSPSLNLLGGGECPPPPLYPLLMFPLFLRCYRIFLRRFRFSNKTLKTLFSRVVSSFFLRHFRIFLRYFRFQKKLLKLCAVEVFHHFLRHFRFSKKNWKTLFSRGVFFVPAVRECRGGGGNLFYLYSAHLFCTSRGLRELQSRGEGTLFYLCTP